MVILLHILRCPGFANYRRLPCFILSYSLAWIYIFNSRGTHFDHLLIFATRLHIYRRLSVYTLTSWINPSGYILTFATLLQK